MSAVELLTKLRNSPTEKFAVFYHTAKGVVGSIMADGDAENVTFDPYEIIETAVANGVSQVSIAHNHPTGPVRPSTGDLDATFKLQDLFKEFSLSLQDHVIVGPEGEAFSMRNKGVI